MRNILDSLSRQMKLPSGWVKANEFSEQLADVGRKLLQPPSSTHELLLLLDQAEALLSKVGQAPPIELHEFLSTYEKPLIQEAILQHPDKSVRIAATSCICELTRITAPVLPYDDDDQMKEIFKLVVFSMASLSNPSSPSYTKAINILSIVARAKVFVVMLDLECNDLIHAMVRIFLTSITSELPPLVLEDMKNIMIALIGESNDLFACLGDPGAEITPFGQNLWEKVFKHCLVDVGSKLLQPPSSTQELLLLLDQAEVLLSWVSQAPPIEHQEIITTYAKPLIREELLQHANNDVRIAATSCICELTRIAAPILPYDDDQMKEIFKHIVFSILSLSHPSSHSYTKAINILSIVARAKVFVVMIDLECNDLIRVMFHLFLTCITSELPPSVFKDMETIMIGLIEESDEVSDELISPIFACLGERGAKVSVFGRKLGKKVLKNCSSRLASSGSRQASSMTPASNLNALLMGDQVGKE